jgi:hypothetical protein
MNLKSKAWLWGSLLFLLLFVGSAALSAGTGEVDRLWLNAPDWSRAKLIAGTAARQPAAMALDDAGRIYLLTIRTEAGTHRVHVIALDRNAEIVWERTLEAPLSEPDRPRILWDGQNLHLFWLDEQSLHAAQLNASGNVQAAPRLLSGETKVGTYEVASDPNGSFTVLYGGTRREPGVYSLPLESSTGKATLVDAEGIQPVARYDNAGTLHAAWITYLPGETQPRFYYADYPDGIFRPGQQTLVAEPPMRSDTALQGPWLGVDQEHVHLFWIEAFRSGHQANQTETKYVSFPVGEPALASEPGVVVVPNTGDLLYEPFLEGGLAAGQRVSLASGSYPRIVSPSEIAVNAAIEGETVLALRAEIRHPRDNIVGQIGALFLQDGAPMTYQLLSFNPKFSLAPAVASDRAGQLYFTWLERNQVSGYQVYFASTAPDIRQALSSLTWGDVGRMTADTFFGMLRGAVFSPFAALLWLVVPFLLLALTWPFRRGGETLTSRASLVSIVLALLAYWAAKLVTFANARTYVPFSAWIPVIPTWLGVLLQFGMPIITAVVALGAAWYFTKRAVSKSALVFVIIYAGVDSLLSMAVYGGLLYNAF